MTSSNDSNKARLPKRRGPVRNRPSPLALEQRLMFDGAGAGDFVAAAEKLPAGDAVQREAQTALPTAESALAAPAASAPLLRIPTSALEASPALAQASVQAQGLLDDFLQRPDAREQLFALFNGGQTEASTAWQQAADTLLAELRSGSYSLQVQLLSGAEMQAALGAFTTQGPGGSTFIFVNADWLKLSPDSASISRVLLEEIGHSLDARLNPGTDTAGDEGEAFAALASGQTLTQADNDRIATEDDHAVVVIDGTAYAVEDAAPTITLRTENLTNDYAIVTSTDKGFTVTAQNVIGGVLSAASSGLLYVRSASPDGFGVQGNASGSSDELGYFSPGLSEQIILNLDHKISAATIQFSWMASSEHATYTLYLDGNLVQSAVTVTGQTDNIDPPVTISANDGSMFNRVIFAAPGPGDDYLIHQITFPVISSVTAIEDTAFSFNGANTLSVTDTDNNLSSTSLSVNHGTLNVTLSGGATLSAGANGSVSLTISGSQTAINQTLATLGYQGVLNFNGSDSMTMVATDATGASDTAKVPITVTPVNDVPVARGNTYTAFAGALMTGRNIITNTDLTAETDSDVETATASLRVARINGNAFAANGTDASHLAAAGWMQVSLSHGVLYVKNDGTTEFSPTPGGNLVDTVDTFTYAVSDGSAISANATVQLNIHISATPTLEVSTVTISEASPYAVFQAKLDLASPTAISFTPSLIDGTATLGADTGTSAALQYFNGATWAAAGTVTMAPGTTTVLLRTAIVNDTVYEGSETFTLSTGAITGTVTNAGAATGTGTIKDDGSSTSVFASTNNTAALTVGSADDDRPTVSVSSATVSEASPYAVFSVSLTNTSASVISFTPSLTAGTATVGTDTGTSGDLQYFDGTAWAAASGGVTIAAGNLNVLLRTAINNEATYEGPETFTLSTGLITGTVFNTDAAAGVGTIKDDGSSTNVFTVSNNTTTATVGTADNDKPTIAVGSVTVSEASAYAVFSVSLTNDSASAISFTPSLSSGTATVGTDTGSSAALQYFNGANWVSASSGVTLTAGSTNVLVRTSIVNDTTYEVSETFTLSTGTITGTVTNVGAATGTGTIKDDGSSTNVFDASNNNATPTVGSANDDKPTVSINDVTVSEASPYAVFSVSLTNASTAAISFTPSLSSGTATVGTDTGASNALQYLNGANWVAVSGAVTIAANSTSVLLRTAIVNDSTYEISESFTLSTGNFTGTLTNAGALTATGTIKDDGSSTNVFLSSNNTATPTVGSANNDKPTVAINDVTVSEASPYAVFSVSLTNASTAAISFIPILTNGSATVGTDTGASVALEYFNGTAWVAASGGVTISASSTNVLLRTAIVNDANYEGPETFTLSTDPITGTVTNTAAATGTGTIKDDGSSTNVFESTNNTATPTVGSANEDRPTVSVSSVTVSEASSYAVFSVSLTGTSTGAVSFTPILANVTAAAGTDTGASADLQYFDGANWVSASLGVTLAAGSTNVLVRTSIVNDTTYEQSETFTLSTGAITGTVANAGAATGTGTIKDDGSSTNVFDASNNSATPTVGSADDDKPTVSVTDVTVSEASDYAVFSVGLTNISTASISFTPSLSSGTATVGTDTSAALEYFNGAAWAPASGGVTIAASSTNVLVRTAIINDTDYEGPETFTLSTDSITGTVTNTGAATGMGTIKDDGSSSNVFAVTNNTANPTVGSTNDDRPTVSVSSVTVSESSSYAVFSVSLSSLSAGAISFTPSITSGTATAGTDTGASGDLQFFDGVNWVAAAGGVSIGAGSTQLLVRTAIVNDTTYEQSETFTLSTGTIIGTVANAGAATGTGTIKDDGSSSNVFEAGNNSATPTVGSANNDKPTVAVNSVTVSEASAYAVFSVSLTNASTAAISFTPSLTSGTATVGTDTGASVALQYFDGASWVSAAAGVTIAAGSTNVLVRTSIVNDTTYEGSESFTLSTGSITGSVANAGAATGTGTVKDDGSSTNVFDASNNSATPTAGSANEDRPTVSVSSVTVSESSPYAVFSVSLTNASTTAISFTPSLTSGTATVDTDTGTSAALQYFDGAGWVSASSGVTMAANSTSVLVRTSIVNDTLYEVSESFTLSTGTINGAVTNTAAATGTGTIKDDGSRTNVFADTNNTATPAVGTANDDKPTVAVNNVTVSEASLYAVFSVSLTNASTAVVSFTPSLTSGTATAGTDTGASGDLQYFDGAAWVSASTGVPIAANSTQVLVRTAIVNDTLYEVSETFTLSTGNITGAVTNGGAATGIGTIKDDSSSTNGFDASNNTATPTVGPANDDKPTVAVSNVTLSEASPYAVFSVSLTNASTAAISFTPSLTSGTATVGTDTGASGGLQYFDGAAWVSATGGVTIAANSTQVPLRTTIVDDAAFEGPETFSLSTGIITGTVTNTAAATGTGTIKDDGSSTNVFAATNNTATPTVGNADNDKPTISIAVNAASMLEDAAGVMTYTFTLDKASAFSSTVSYTISGTATSGSDFTTTATGTLTITAGQFTASFTVDPTADALFESDETVLATIDSAATMGQALTITTATATGTITNDDAAPSFSIASASTIEGGVATFTVSRVGDAQATQSVSYAASIVGANTASANDFSTTSGTLSFATGETSKTFTVQTTADTLFEADEIFSVTLSSATAGATIATGTAIGTINNDDAAPSFSIASASVTEGGVATFTVSRSGDAQASQTVSYATSIAGGNTTSANDFSAASGVLSFASGESTKTFTVQTTADTLFEADEDFTVALSSATAGATIATVSATGSITNDDAAPSLSIASASTTEGGIATFTVSRSGDAQATQSVSYATSTAGSNTATANDFSAVSGTLSFASGETAKTFTVQTTADTLSEADETFSVTLNSPTGGATITTASAAGTILNDDAAPSFSIASAGTAEGGVATFTVNRSGDAQAIQTVSYATSIAGGNTASASDFSAASGMLSFASGETAKTFTVQTTADTLFEADETFTVAISSARAGATIATASAIGTILNDDAAPTFSIANASAIEGGIATFTVTRSGDAQETQFVIYATSIGASNSASSDDFSAASGTLSFATGQTSQTFTVQTSADSSVEADETFTVMLNSPTGGATAVATTASATGTVLNNDLAISNPTVNEASPYAVFMVSGSAGQQLKLELTGDSATGGGTDFGAPGPSNLQVSTDSGASWSNYADTATLPASAAMLVRTTVNEDNISDNSETFNLTATPAGGAPAIGKATLKDDGTGDLYLANGSLNASGRRTDDRALSVNSISVNEASPYAVFRVSGAAGQIASLALADGTAGSADYGGALQVSADSGATWAGYASGNTALNASGLLLVRTPVKPDSVSEGAETFTLAATNSGGSAGNGTATIRDDGAGTVFKNDGSDDSAAIRDDDRALSVNSVSVSEFSPYAVFEIQGATGQLVRLALKSGSATVGVDIGSAIETFNGSSWQAYKDAVAMPGATMLVRVAVIDDSLFEGLETFTLEATNGGGAVFSGTGTIADDSSTPQVFLADNNSAKPSIGRADDDQPKPPPVQVEAVLTPAATSMLTAAPVTAQAITPRAGSSTIGSAVWVPEVINPKAIAPPVEVPTLVMAERIPDQYADRNSVAGFAVPDRTFMVSTPGQQLTLTAEQANGTPLPTWLNFNSNTRRFEGQPPPDFVGEVKLKVTARDGQGGEAEAQFRLQIGNPDNAAPAASPAPSSPAAPSATTGRISLQQQLRDLAPPRRGDLARINTARNAAPAPRG